MDRRPDGSESRIEKLSICQFGQPGRPCPNHSSVQWDEATTQETLTRPLSQVEFNRARRAYDHTLKDAMQSQQTGIMENRASPVSAYLAEEGIRKVRERRLAKYRLGRMTTEQEHRNEYSSRDAYDQIITKNIDGEAWTKSRAEWLDNIANSYPHPSRDRGPPPSTRGFDRIKQGTVEGDRNRQAAPHMKRDPGSAEGLSTPPVYKQREILSYSHVPSLADRFQPPIDRPPAPSGKRETPMEPSVTGKVPQSRKNGDTFTEDGAEDIIESVNSPQSISEARESQEESVPQKTLRQRGEELNRTARAPPAAPAYQNHDIVRYPPGGVEAIQECDSSDESSEQLPRDDKHKQNAFEGPPHFKAESLGRSVSSAAAASYNRQHSLATAASIYDDDFVIVAGGQARIMVGGVEIDCSEEGEVEIPVKRRSGYRDGGRSRMTTQSILNYESTQVVRETPSAKNFTTLSEEPMVVALSRKYLDQQKQHENGTVETCDSCKGSTRL